MNWALPLSQLLSGIRAWLNIQDIAFRISSGCSVVWCESGMLELSMPVGWFACGKHKVSLMPVANTQILNIDNAQ